ncbi:MAG: MGH1-like glycoside hydrolase domain-containing protein [Acetobacteraceae bacterium]
MTDAPGAARAAARAILRANDRGGYTVPSARLYPFQWNWDSALVAMGWATCSESRGWQEVETLLAGQWDDGMVPHILFHAPSGDYFPGPAVWGLARLRVPSSGIPQPPVLATAVRRMLERARAPEQAKARAAALYPKLLGNHRWWARARDPERRGLVTTLHPWETGMDNSPAWDIALARVPRETGTPIVRRDLAHVESAMRPALAEYERYIHLVDLFRSLAWEPGRMLRQSPFRVADVGTNAILLRAERDLLALARRFGTAAEGAEIDARSARLAAALEGLFSATEGIYLGRDQVADRPITVATSAGLLPIFAGERAHAGALAERIESWRSAAVPWPVPSSAPGGPGFDPRRYWRGPVWPFVNWMLAQGFAAAGNAALASLLGNATARMIETGGFYEYFDPRDASGLGGENFSWTAAIWLVLAESRP